MSFGREKSIVRFEPRVDIIDQKLQTYSTRTRTTTKLLGTQTSSLKGNRVGLTHKYVPRLHRQTTEIPSATPLGSALQQFTQSSLLNEYSLSEKSSALEEVKTIVNKVAPSLARNLLGLQFLPAVFALGFSHWHKQPQRRVVCYLPVRLPKAEIHHKTSDKVFIKLPQRFPPSMNIEPSVLEWEECKFLSSKKLYSLMIRMLRRLLMLKSVSSDQLRFSSSDRLLEIQLQKTDGWIGEIVPCVVTGGSHDVLYCCKPFNQEVSSFEPDSDDSTYKNEFQLNPEDDDDANIDDSGLSSSASLESVQPRDHDQSSSNRSHDGRDRNMEIEINVVSKDEDPQPIITDSTVTIEDSVNISWYPCNPQGENSVVNTISKTDGGIRMTAMMIVCRLAQHDWRLLPLRCYDVQTAMFHDVEHHLDHSPRWQRNSLEHCVHSLLSKLYKFAKRSGGLPHFSVSGIELWSEWTPKQLALAKSALERLMSSDTALVSLVCRTGNINFENLIQPLC